MGRPERLDTGHIPVFGALAGSDALLGAAICAYEDAADGMLLPRHSWAVQVLVEHLLDQLSESPWGDSLTGAMWDPKRGVTSRVVDDATYRLVVAGWLAPSGGRHDPAWMVTERGRAQGRQMLLSGLDREAVSVAAQRALAITDAWLKNFRA